MNLLHPFTNIWHHAAKILLFPKGLLAVAVCPLLFSCSTDIPDGVISESKMENLLYDYHIAQAMAEARTDSVGQYRYLYIRSVFDKYGITEAEFDSSMIWYSSNASFLADMYVRINERYTAELKSLGSHVNQADMFQSVGSSGDTANVWHDTNFCLLRPQNLANKFSFALQTDTSFHAGDDLMWRFDNFYVYQEGFQEAFAALVLHFENDSVASVYERISQNQTTNLRIRTSPEDCIRKITGFVYLPSLDQGQKEAFRMMLLRNFKLIRFHEQKSVASTDSARVEKGRSLSESNLLQADSVTADSVSKVRLSLDSSKIRRLSPSELRRKQQRGQK